MNFFPTNLRIARRLSVGACLVVLIGCSSPPAGSTGGRMDIYRTTAADRASGAANMPALLEFSEQAAEKLTRDLIDIPEITGLPSKAILELGNLNNQTATPINDFRMIQRRMRGQLLKSQLIRSKFIVVADRSRMDGELNRVVGPDHEGATARYDPNATFMLLGDFFESRRGNVRRYYFAFSLVNLGSRQTVFQKDYDLAQQ